MSVNSHYKILGSDFSSGMESGNLQKEYTFLKYVNQYGVVTIYLYKCFLLVCRVFSRVSIFGVIVTDVVSYKGLDGVFATEIFDLHAENFYLI